MDVHTEREKDDIHSAVAGFNGLLPSIPNRFDVESIALDKPSLSSMYVLLHFRVSVEGLG